MGDLSKNAEQRRIWSAIYHQNFGIHPLLFSFFLLALVYIFCLAIKELVEKPFDWRLLLGLIVFPLLVNYLYRFITGQKIEISENQLISQYSSDGGQPLLTPRFYYGKIDLADIESITIATIKYFEEHMAKFQDDALKDQIGQYRNMSLPMTNSPIPFSVPMGMVTGSIPLIFIASKSSTANNITNTTKPFSKKSIKQFIQALRMRDIEVVTEPALRLE